MLIFAITTSLLVPDADAPYAPKYTAKPEVEAEQCPYPVTSERTGEVLYYTSRAGCVSVPASGPQRIDRRPVDPSNHQPPGMCRDD